MTNVTAPRRSVALAAILFALTTSVPAATDSMQAQAQPSLLVAPAGDASQAVAQPVTATHVTKSDADTDSGSDALSAAPGASQAVVAALTAAPATKANTDSDSDALSAALGASQAAAVTAALPAAPAAANGNADPGSDALSAAPGASQAAVASLTTPPAATKASTDPDSSALSATGSTSHAVVAPLITPYVRKSNSGADSYMDAEGGSSSGAEPAGINSDAKHFVASDASIQTLLNALSASLKRPIIASALVRAKHVTGVFDLTQPKALLYQLSGTMSLVWYDDGSSLYIYDNSEIKNAMVSMQYATLGSLRNFIHETKLYDERFPLRGDDISGTFYVTGAPIYVNLVVAAAKYLDQLRGSETSGRMVMKIVPLHNTFVMDRSYMLRDNQVVVRGIASVLNQLFDGMSGGPSGPVDNSVAVSAALAKAAAVSNSPAPSALSAFSLANNLPAPQNGAATGDTTGAAKAPLPGQGILLKVAPGVRAIAYADTNSIVLIGDLDRVEDMEQIIRTLDVPKRQIQLSLWIIDVKKGVLNRLGIDWQGAASVGDLALGFNGGSVSTLNNSVSFLAQIHMMSLSGDAKVISRPIVLTQENVPAIFDNNQTFYTQLVGDHVAQLDHVTYGTLINVLPRLTPSADQVEMQVNVEDGDTTAGGASVSNLPVVNRTQITTIARVPTGKSLLIGGNTMDEVIHTQYKIPGLGDIPFLGSIFRGHTDSHEQVARLYLIEPTLLNPDASWQEGQDLESDSPDQNDMLRSTVKLLQPYMGNK